MKVANHYNGTSPHFGTPDFAPLPIWHLEARERVGKQWRWRADGTLDKTPLKTPYQWRWYSQSVPHGDVEALAAMLQSAGRYGKTIWTTGEPIDGKAGSGRRLKHAKGDTAATFHETARPWLPMDLDTLHLPNCDVVSAPEIAVARAVDQLGDAFADVSYVWQFSSSQRPDSENLKLRVIFFTDRPITNAERKRWAKTAPIPVDASIYHAAGEIYIGAPLILSATGEVCTDWLPVRTGFYEGERDSVALPVPPEPVYTPIAPPADGEAVRCPGVLNRLVDAIQRAVEGTKHTTLNTAAFTAGGYVAGGAVTLEEARQALRAAIRGRDVVSIEAADVTIDRALQDGMQKPLYVEAPPLPVPDAPELPTAQEAAVELDTALREFFAAALSDAPKHLGIQGAAGLGKTTRALSIAREVGATVDHYVPTIALAFEQAERLPAGAAIVIRGRTHAEGDRKPLCAKHEAADALQAAGFGQSQQRLLCGKPSPSGRFPCPHAAGCAYHAQFKSTAPIRFYAHNFLTIGLSEDKPERAANVAIVDEKFASAFEDHCRWSLAALGEAGGVFITVADAIRQGTLNKADHLMPVMLALGAKPPGPKLPIHPEMSAVEALRALKNWQLENADTGKRDPYDFLESVKAALVKGEERRFYATGDNGKTTIRYAGLKPLAASAPAWLFLDASLNPAMVQKVKPGTEIKEIHARRNVRVVQITNSALSHTRLEENARYLSARLGELAERLKAADPNGAVIAPVNFLKLAQANGYFRDLPSGHYGALRGLNTLEAASWLVQIGRNELPVYAVEASARAWFITDGVEFGTVKRTPGWLTAKDGSQVQTPHPVTSFTDPYCQAILKGGREQESLQGVDRLRLIHADQPKTVYLLSNVPLLGLQPDVLVNLDDLLLPGRLAVVMLRDKALTGPAMLANRHPDLWDDERQARRDLQELKGGKSLYKILIGNCPPLKPIALVPVEYRTHGQKGSNRRALLYANADPIAVLTALHGEPIRLIGDTPMADPIPAAPPIPAPVPPPTDEVSKADIQVSDVTRKLDYEIPPIPPGVGNIRWWLGCPFDADWERTEPDEAALEAAGLSE